MKKALGEMSAAPAGGDSPAGGYDAAVDELMAALTKGDKAAARKALKAALIEHSLGED